VSFDAIRWALAQSVSKSSAKFLLVAMADCVNADNAEMVCWPSYAYLARITEMNTKTVEACVSRLKEEGFIVDTGKRSGGTGKVVVYRLNDPNLGVVTPGPQDASYGTISPANTPKFGVIAGDGNDPKKCNKRPQKVVLMTPKTGVRTSNGTRKEAGSAARPPVIAGVSECLMADYMAVRKAKRAGPLTDTAISALHREAEKAGITVSEAIQFCCENSWQGFNAGWYADRVAQGSGIKQHREQFV
jgi:pyocin large subunit-like protein